MTSGNLQWELAQIRQMGTDRKLGMFTSPRSLRKSVAEIMRAEDSSREDLLSDWSLGRSGTGSRRFRMRAGMSRLRSRLELDDAGKSVLLTTDANTPEDYVMPVASWIAYSTRTGKCILTTCDPCGMCAYVAPNPSATSSRVLCFICAQKQNWRQWAFWKSNRSVSDTWYALPLWLLILCCFPASDFLDSVLVGPLLEGTYSVCSAVHWRLLLFVCGRQMASNWVFENSYQQSPIFVAGQIRFDGTCPLRWRGPARALAQAGLFFRTGLTDSRSGAHRFLPRPKRRAAG